MNSLTWLLTPRRPQSPAGNHPDQPSEPSRKLSIPPSPSTPALDPASQSSIPLGTRPRESEAELVDDMFHSIERQSGLIVANKLERKISMGLDGQLRFGLPGITERRRKFLLEPGSTKSSRSNSIDSPPDPPNISSSSSSPSPPSSSSPTTTSPPRSRSPINLLFSYSPYRHLIQLLPIRLGVKLYALIRKFLSLFGLRLSPPDSSSPTPSSATAATQEPIPYHPLRTRLFRSMWSKLFSFRIRSSPPASSASASSKLSSSAASSVQVKGLVRRNKTLVLDLDETLIHSTSRLGGMGGSKTTWSNQSNSTTGLKVRVVEVVLDGRIVVYHVYKRPWVDFFLKTVSSWYTVVIFTASMREYADPVIDWLDQGRGLIEGRLFRESCTNIKGSYVKDLTVVERDLSKVCLVDNSPISYGLHQANGIPIEGWLNDPKDEGLLELLPMLDSLRFTNDVRRILGLKAFSLQPPSPSPTIATTTTSYDHPKG